MPVAARADSFEGEDADECTCGAKPGEPHADDCPAVDAANIDNDGDGQMPADEADDVRKLSPKGKRAGSLHVTWMAENVVADLTDNKAVLNKAYPKARTLKLAGTYIDTSVNLNNWCVPASELANIAQQLASGKVQMRLDHSEGVRDVIGLYTGARLFDREGNPIAMDASDDELAKADRVDFDASITSEDASVMVPILQGYVRGVSPNLVAGHVECSVCGKKAHPNPTCDHFKGENPTGAYRLRDVRVKEGSVVATPAYGERTPVIPIGFAAGLNQKTSEMRRMATKDEKAGAGASGAEAGATGAAASDSDKLARAQSETISAQAALIESQKANLALYAAMAKAAEDPVGSKKKQAAKKGEDAAEASADEDEASAAESEDTEDAKKKAKKKASVTLDDRVAAVRAGAKAGAEEKPADKPAFANQLGSNAYSAADKGAVVEMFEASQGKRAKGSFYQGGHPLLS